jgi:hypothetical protein
LEQILQRRRTGNDILPWKTFFSFQVSSNPEPRALSAPQALLSSWQRFS